jgi:hypothetical protein
MEEYMRLTIMTLSFAAAIGLMLSGSASAQYMGGMTKHHGYKKCYNEFVIGKYSCHYFK